MRNPLTYMLYPTILIIAKEVLLVRYWGTYRSNNGNNRNNIQNNSHQAAGNNPPRQSSNKEPLCYHCMGPHYITKCAKYQQDKDMYKHTKQQVKQNYQNKLKLGAKKNNV